MIDIFNQISVNNRKSSFFAELFSIPKVNKKVEAQKLKNYGIENISSQLFIRLKEAQ